jgi:hypothetical protein
MSHPGRGLLFVSLVACSGADPSEGAPAASASEFAPSSELLAESWMVQSANEEVLKPFQTPGWFALLNHRDLPKAARSLGGDSGLSAARAHADAAAMYRQAALCSARAITETYGETPQEGDPAGTAHLLAASYLMLGEPESAKTHLAAVATLGDDPSSAWHGVWSTGAWPPNTDAAPLDLGEAAGAGWPGLGTLPHYELPEQTESARTVKMGDPTALAIAALWHDGVAAQAAGDAAALVDIYDARYLLPAEATPPQGEPLPLALIFGSELLHPQDGNFLLAVRENGLGAVDAFKGKSLLADLTARTIVDGKIDTERARDMAQTLRRIVVDEMRRVGGSDMEYHRVFADVARVAALRHLAYVAHATGDTHAEGTLRISALDHSTSGPTANPPWLLSMCAFDAGNRFPSRAYDLLHNLISRVPELETARYGLDVLSLRVSRESGAGQLPGM